jgi:hypothetical protein
MIRQVHPRTPRGLRSTSSPGLTKQFRIQVLDPEADSWRMYANFRYPGEAEACLDALRQRGIEARILSTDLRSQSPQ